VHVALMLAVLCYAPVITARASTTELEINTKSPEAVAFDLNATVETRGNYVNGSIAAEARGPFSGTNINALLGATKFYDYGYTGTNVVVANIEEGHIWNGHETLTHVLQIPNHAAALNEFDRHATWVGMILGGRRGGTSPGPYQEGIAPGVLLYSGAFAPQWSGPRYSESVSGSIYAAAFDQYRHALSTGVNETGRRADVVNSSWAEDWSAASASGTTSFAVGIDGFVNANPHSLFVVSAGNFGPGPDKVYSPASAYNNLSVAALGPNPPYNRPALFSSGGPNDYVDPVNGIINDARQVVDIAAPGQNLSSAYYGGETGGNGTTDNPTVAGTGPTGPASGPAGGPDYYTRGGLNGTSFSAPTVAGGAALLYDAAYSMFASNDNARDARVMKAVLMNSADKTIGWNNGQTAHPNGKGGVITTQGLDNRVGTGRMNLYAAYDQFLSGTTDIPGVSSGNLGQISNSGWDFGEVVSSATNDYYFDLPLLGGSTFSATLTWFRDRRIDGSNAVFDDSYDDLNLELWSVADGVPLSLIAESSSQYNESEHFSFLLPSSGYYALRIRWFGEIFDLIGDANQELYGLAWSAMASLPGDFNFDGAVDAADYVAWRKTDGTPDGYNTWRTNFGQPAGSGSVLPSAESLPAVPEPSTDMLLILPAAWSLIRRCRGFVGSAVK
jgi:hypothetical protein